MGVIPGEPPHANDAELVELRMVGGEERGSRAAAEKWVPFPSRSFVALGRE